MLQMAPLNPLELFWEQHLDPAVRFLEFITFADAAPAVAPTQAPRETPPLGKDTIDYKRLARAIIAQAIRDIRTRRVDGTGLKRPHHHAQRDAAAFLNYSQSLRSWASLADVVPDRVAKWVWRIYPDQMRLYTVDMPLRTCPCRLCDQKGTRRPRRG